MSRVVMHVAREDVRPIIRWHTKFTHSLEQIIVVPVDNVVVVNASCWHIFS